MNSYLFPSADAIKQAFVSSRDMMVDNTLVSFELLIPSVTVSLLIVLFLGIIMGMNARVREVLYPVTYAFSVMPSILLSPFVFLMAPSPFSASVFLIVCSIMWAIFFATVTGIMTIDKRYLDRAVALELRGSKGLIKVILPTVSSSILVGFVDSLHSFFVMLVFAEMYGTGQGMGYFMKKYAELGIFADTRVGPVFMVIILIIATQISELLKKHLLRWTTDQGNSTENQRQLGKRLEKIRPA